MQVKETTSVLFLLLSVRVAGSSAISRTYNITVDCGDYNIVAKTVGHCQRDILRLADYGFHWIPRGNHRNSTHNLNVTDRNNTLRDALDSLNQVCYIH